MDKLLYVLPVLACPIAMGAMMWLMMRGDKKPAPTDQTLQTEITALRNEIITLRMEQDLRSDTVDSDRR